MSEVWYVLHLGDFDDEKRHKSFCEQSQKSLLLKGNIDERQIVETLRGEDLGSVDDRIILIRGARSSKQKIDAALGHPNDPLILAGTYIQENVAEQRTQNQRDKQEL